MDVQYYNLYTHFVFTTQNRFPSIEEVHRERIEKYITGIVNNHQCKSARTSQETYIHRRIYAILEVLSAYFIREISE
jgi:hypothetical protein